MQWKPNRSKPLIEGIPLKRPSQEQINKAYMLFYSMIGGFASVVQTQITDVYNYARQDKKLFRMEAKKRLTEAKRCSDELVESFGAEGSVGLPIQGSIFNKIIDVAQRSCITIRSGASGTGKTRNAVADACILAFPIRYNSLTASWEQKGSNQRVLFMKTRRWKEC